MIRAVSSSLCLVLIALAVPVQAQSPTPSDRPPACDFAAPAGWQGVVLIAEGDDIRIEARGRKAIDPASPIMPDTRFAIHSLGKMFTAVGIVQLVEQGKVDLDAGVGRYLPELKPPYSDLTLRQLLSHTAGMGSYLEEASIDDLRAIPTARGLVPYLVNKPLKSLGVWRYSNSSFALAGAVIEAVSGQSYHDYVQANILDRANMAATSFDMAPGDAVAVYQGADGRPAPHRLNALRGGPAGGAFAPAADLLRFAQALQGGKLVRPDQLKAMTGFQVEEEARGDGVQRGWGLGFGTSLRDGVVHFGHVGGIPGAGAALRMRDDQARTVIALADQDNVDAPRASGRAMAAKSRLADCG